MNSSYHNSLKMIGACIYLLNAIPQAEHHPFWLLPFVIVFILLTYSIDLAGRRIAHAIIFGVIPISIFAILFLLSKNLGGLYWGSALLISACGFKIAESRRHRDLQIFSYLLIMLNLTTLLYDTSITTTIFSLALVVLNLTYIYLLQKKRISFTFFILGMKSGLITIVLAVPLTVILFIIFPRIQQSPGGIYNNKIEEAVTGISDTLSPGSIAVLIESDETAFTVIFDGDPPAHEQLYFRGFSLGRYENNIWRKYIDQRVVAQNYGVVSDEGGQGKAIQASYSLKPSSNNRLFPLDQPISGSGALGYYSGGQIKINPFIRSLGKIKFLSVNRDSYPAFLPDALLQEYLSIERDSNPKTYELGRGWHGNGFENIISSINQYYLENSLRYSTTPGKASGPASDYFLFESKTGYCEHFANSYALLLRSAGVASRIVVGFAGGEWNTVNNSLRIQLKYAHAWVEAYNQNTGTWHRIDPTKLSEPERFSSEYFVQPNATDWIKDYYEAVDLWWNDKVLGYTSFDSRSFFNLFSSSFNNLLKPNFAIIIFIILIGFFLLQEVRKRSLLQEKDIVLRRFLNRLIDYLSMKINTSQVISEKELAVLVNSSLIKNKEEVADFIMEYQKRYYGPDKKSNILEFRKRLEKIVRAS